MISLIVAIADNRVIGKDNQLIWHLPADLKRFKQLTMGHHMVMGRKTFDSIGKALPGRTSVVITRQHGWKKENVIKANSLQSALSLCGTNTEIFIIGGAQIFSEALSLADKIYLTHIHYTFDGDVFFPELNEDNWETTFNELHKADEKNPFDYSFINYERKR